MRRNPTSLAPRDDWDFMHDGSFAPPATARFNRKRDAIVAAARKGKT